MLYFRNGLAKQTGSLELKAALHLDGTLITITCLQEQSVMDIGVLALLAQGDWSGGRSLPCCDSHHSCWTLRITFCCLFFFLMKISRNGGLRCNWVIIPFSLFLESKRTVCQQVGALSCVMYMCNILFPKPRAQLYQLCLIFWGENGVCHFQTQLLGHEHAAGCRVHHYLIKLV